jgi:cysteine desulfurase
LLQYDGFGTNNVTSGTRHIYLDYMATTPLDTKVIAAMQRIMRSATAFANPSAQGYASAREANQATESARHHVATAINAAPETITFTSGATESNNIAIQGAARGFSRQGMRLLTVATEHKAVLQVFNAMSQQGFSTEVLMPKSNGELDLEVLAKALKRGTTLVSVMHVNNETGVVQDIKEIATLVHQFGALLHVDAAQSIGKLPVDVLAWQADLVSLSAHKCYGPKGVGALYVRAGLKLPALMYGGGQERGLRAGTLATHQIVGMGEAYRLVQQQRFERQRIETLRDEFYGYITEQLPEVVLHGDSATRVPHVLNLGFPGVNGGALLYALQHSLAVSSGSACNAATLQPSHVLRAMGVSVPLANASVRFSFGHPTSSADCQHAASMVVAAVQDLQQLWVG